MYENIKCGYAISWLEFEKYFGTKMIWACYHKLGLYQLMEYDKLPKLNFAIKGNVLPHPI